MTDQSATTGRHAGTLSHGSLTNKLMALKVGESVLMPSVGANPQVNYSVTVKRAKAHTPSKDWKVHTCYGFAVTMEDKPFKFYQITRTQ